MIQAKTINPIISEAQKENNNRTREGGQGDPLGSMQEV